MKRVRNMLFIAVLLAGFLASREAVARGQDDCFACTGIFGETCEPCQGGEDCGTRCLNEYNEEGCTIWGVICYPLD